jgi:hypothetical protein
MLQNAALSSINSIPKYALVYVPMCCCVYGVAGRYSYELQSLPEAQQFSAALLEAAAHDNIYRNMHCTRDVKNSLEFSQRKF